MSLITINEYAEKIGKARVTVRGKIWIYDIEPVDEVKIGNNKRPSYLFRESDLNTMVFYKKVGRPKHETTS
jgi:response regulator of citrate/malate metabolism